MKKNISISSFVLLALLPALRTQAQDSPSFHVEFRMHSAELPENSAVYITGGIEQLGNWDPGKVRMESRGNHTWVMEINVSGIPSVEYKYTLGSWDREGAASDGSPLANLEARIAKDTVIHDEILSWTDKRSVAPKSSLTGTVIRHRGLEGKGILPRDVLVWTPEGYGNDLSARYPVVYLHDGQNVFDAATSAFGTEWRVDETLDSLIRIRAIPPVIAVAIYNSPDRNNEYSPGDKGTAYMEFLVNTLKPFIDSAYRTRPGASSTLVCGASSGGTISFMLAWEHPQVFSTAICFSPAFKYDQMDYVKVVRAYEGPRKNNAFYIYNGGVGLETQLQPGIDDMLAALKDKGYMEGKNMKVVYDPGAKHFESAWAKQFPGAIIWCLKDQ